MFVFTFRAPPKEKKEIDVDTLFELLREVDPKEYEKYARHYGITDFRQLLSRCEDLRAQESQV